jgi:tetratricopeptide (TPR) repeat protein
MQDFDQLWNYNEPAATAEKFLALLANSSIEKDKNYHLELLSQVARTYSLRGLFAEAHQCLSQIEPFLEDKPTVFAIRYHLEKGRTYNSAKEKELAKPHFEKAEQLALAVGEDAYALDALHMLAIVSVPPLSIQYNEKALLLAQKSGNVQAQKWQGALYNNLGWDYFDLGQYEDALQIFLQALKWREEQQSAPEFFLAKWCVARTLRALNRLDEAIKIQLALMEEMLELSQPDGYVYEELGELYLLRNEPIHKMYFQFTLNELGQNPYLLKNEAARINRWKILAEEHPEKLN